MDQDEIYEDIWEGKVNEGLPYLKKDVLSTAFSYAGYSKRMEEITGFGREDCLNVTSLAKKQFKSSRDENDEPINKYKDEKKRFFVRKA